MSLYETFRDLPRPSRPGSFSAERTPRSSRVAKSYEGHPAVLINFGKGTSRSLARRLASLVYVPPSPVDVVDSSGATTTTDIAILECTTIDRRLASYFFDVSSSVLVPEAESGDEQRFELALDAVIALFRALQRPGARTIQGLWGELAIIAWSAAPVEALSAWHSSPRALHDFSVGSMRFEVKSTTSELREHIFLLEQLSSRTAGATVIASLLLQADPHGSSVLDLVAAIRLRLNGQIEPMRRLEAVVAESLGASLDDVDEHRFDLDLARASMLLFPASAIPTIPEPLPSEIRNVQFTVDLSTAKPVSAEAVRALGALYDSLLARA